MTSAWTRSSPSMTQISSAFLQTAWPEWLSRAGFKGEAIPTVWPARRMSQPIPDPYRGQAGLLRPLVPRPRSVRRHLGGGLCQAQVALTGAERICAGGERGLRAVPPAGTSRGARHVRRLLLPEQRRHRRPAPARHRRTRVAILDVDFHHGNGTQDIFYARDDVLFLSLHGDPMDAFPHFLGHADETGTGAGDGFTVNYPLPPGTTLATWREALADALGADGGLCAGGADRVAWRRHVRNRPDQFLQAEIGRFHHLRRAISRRSTCPRCS